MHKKYDGSTLQSFSSSRNVACLTASYYFEFKAYFGAVVNFFVLPVMCAFDLSHHVGLPALFHRFCSSLF